MLTGVRASLGFFIFLVVAASPAAARNAAEKQRQVDTGTFAVLVKGKRVATERFHIDQGATYSTAVSDFKAETGNKSVQHAELQITSAGQLRRYEWHELSPGKAKITVEPADQFIIAHIAPNPPEQPLDQPFILPLSTLVLDDYFFSQREILLWRYLAEACGGKVQQCRPGRTSFGVLVPQQRTSVLVTLEYTGIETVSLGRKGQELRRISLKSADQDEWLLYMDTDLKLVRIDIPAQTTQVMRE